jgi:hypothetical protein
MLKLVKPQSPYLILYQQGQRREIPGQGIGYVQWIGAYDIFLGHTCDGIPYVITIDGEITEIPVGPGWIHDDMIHKSLEISPDGQKWA